MKGILISVGVMIMLLITIIAISRMNKQSKSPTQAVTLPIITQQAPTIKNQEPVFIPPRITLDRIFESDKKWVATLSAQRITKIIATGDVIPARSVNVQTRKRRDFTWAFANTAETLRSADYTIINLETPLLEDCQSTDSGMRFCGDSLHTEGFKFAGIDAANFANNHMGNYGQFGVEQTRKLLIENGIMPFGIQGLDIVTIKGKRVALVGYNDIPPLDGLVAVATEEKITEDIKEAKKKSDLIIVSFHWGEEYVAIPSARQRLLGRLAIDSGADLVLGNHPHWIQPVEVYNEKVIMYAHGNFVFDQMWSEETKLGVIGKYSFFDTTLIDVEFIPIHIASYGQPYILEDVAKESVLDRLKSLSYKFSSL